MNKSFTTFASALVLTMAVASTASARDGFYLALRGGMTNYNLNNKDDSVAKKSRADFGDVWNMSGAIGYKYKFIRVEGEYIYRDDVDDTYKIPGLSGTYQSTLESDSFMANMYVDLMPNYWISPFISGGLGWTRLDLSNQDTGQLNKVKYSSDNFTWSLGAGLSIRLNRCLNIDGGYRYLDMGDIEKANMNAHEWYGGLRFTF